MIELAICLSSNLGLICMQINGGLMMFKLSEKVKYMALGALIAFAGFMLGSTTQGIEAQSESKVIDKLVVGELDVQRSIRVMGNTGLAQVSIDSSKVGGRIHLYNKNWEPLITLGILENGMPSIGVKDEKGGGMAALGIDKNKGYGVVHVADTYRQAKVVMGAPDGKGLVVTQDKFGKRRELD